ncbi:MAG TPA: sulfate ABC transporter substrate-binding protein [Solirubrobacterales bacterium]
MAALFALLLAVLVAGCGSSSNDSSASSSGGGKLDVVGYSTPESVYQESLEPAFEKTSAGSGVSFSNSFGASGDQSRAVVAGQPASVVHFSQAGDMERLVEEGELVSKDWEKQPHGGIATDSVVVLVVRKGNPKGIQSFDDLQSQDVGIVTPNPFSSGSARWNIMAVYGTAINEGKSPAQALEAVKTVLEKTEAQPGSGRDALAAFTQGEGDVLLSYENEAIKAEKEGEDVEYVVPDSTLLIETPIAVTESAPEPAAEEFLKFLWSDEGQEIWAENGYRPVNPKLVDAKQFPTPKELFKISQFGGWGKVNDEFFDDETGSVAKIEGELGVSTSG